MRGIGSVYRTTKRLCTRLVEIPAYEIEGVSAKGRDSEGLALDGKGLERSARDARKVGLVGYLIGNGCVDRVHGNALCTECKSFPRARVAGLFGNIGSIYAFTLNREADLGDGHTVSLEGGGVDFVLHHAQLETLEVGDTLAQKRLREALYLTVEVLGLEESRRNDESAKIEETMKTLERLSASGYTIDEARTLTELENMSEEERLGYVRPVEEVFTKYEAVELPDFFARLAHSGLEIYLHKIKKQLDVGTIVRLYDKLGFFAVGEVKEYEDGLAIKPIRQF